MKNLRQGWSAHISKAFSDELTEIYERILQMGDCALEQLADTLGAIDRFDFALAREIDRRDLRLNRLELGIAERCTEVLARRNPTASDLRLVLAGIRFATDCERIGDELSRVARHLCRLKSADRLAPYMECVWDMGDRAHKQMDRAMRAFRTTKAAHAYEVFHMERETDSAYQRHLEDLLSSGNKGTKVRIFVFDALHAFERIGDHASNIAEQAVYVVDGVELRHDGAELGAEAPDAPPR